MVGLRRLNNVQACVDDVLTHNVPGDLVETGVWRGGSAMLMRAVLQRHGIRDRKVWCCDSFEGMPVPGEADKKVASNADFSDRDYLCVSLDQVKENFHRFELLDDQVEFIKGWFCDTLPDAPIEVIAVLRLDGDLYASTMDSLHNLYPKVAPGGYVIVDDYNSWAGCHQAVDDYRKQHEISAELLEIDPHAVYWQVPY